MRAQAKNEKAYVVGQISLSVIGAVVALVPIWVLVGIWALIEPSTFWQKFAILAVGGVVGGALQFWMVVLFVGFLAAIWEWDG